VIVFLLVGLPIVQAAWSALRQGRIVVEQLFLSGIVGAFTASLHATFSGSGSVYYEVVAVLVAIYTLGRVLGRRRRENAIQAANKLREEFATARRLIRAERSTCGQRPDDLRVEFERVPVARIVPGDRVRVLSGEGVPVDGQILDGTSFVRETALNGEIFPVVRRAGDEILAGSILEDGALTLEALRPGNQRRLDQMLGALSDAATQKSRIEREADRIVGWFLPLVMALAAGTFVFWTATSGWQTGLFNAMAVLLVACPCAMGLATPIGIWNALNDLAHRGIVLKSGEAIEALGTVDTVVFDKTGTLSDEHYAVVDAATTPGVNRAALRRQLAAVQSCSTHPVAAAFAEWAGPAPDGAAKDFRTLPGIGISGWIDGAQIAVGNTELVKDARHATSLALLRDQLPSAPGAQEFVVLVDGELAMLAQLREQFRESAARCVQTFNKYNIPVWVMTGDPKWNASLFAGVTPERTLVGMTPEAKAAKIAELAAQRSRVLFVGDGSNDAPAMAVAHASLALASGSDLSRSSASGELFGGEITRVADAVAVCRRALRAIRTNLIFAATYNCVGITLAVAGVLHPVAAALLMLASSVTVTVRALGRRGIGLSSTADEKSEEEKQFEGLDAPVPSASWSEIALRTRRLVQGSLPAAACLTAQGAVIPALGGMHATAWYGAIFITAALAVGVRLLWPMLGGLMRQSINMVAIGGLAMLGGWWVDAGLAPVVRDGVCLCGCAKSDLGWGLISNLRFMDLAMVAACFGIALADSSRRRMPIWAWGVGAAGMVIGMKVGVAPMAFVPIENACVSFVLSYIAMLIGMLLGAVVASRVIALMLTRIPRRLAMRKPLSTHA
jgi:heavy metal translocating P-type ATPase